MKEYYKLEGENETSASSRESPSSSLAPAVVVTSDRDYKPPPVQEGPQTKQVAPADQPIEQLNFQDLVRMHNRLLSKETETNNSIKNTIYENYYDLIKVNDLLKGMTGANENELTRLREAVKLLLN